MDDGPNLKLIFIDCGGGMPIKEYRNILSDSSKGPGMRLGNLFEKISEARIFVTHNHDDHLNLCKKIGEIGKKSGCVVPSSFKPMSCEKFIASQKKEVLLQKDWENFCTEDLPHMEDSLGPRVRVVPMRPERWKDNEAKSPEHDFNMMYLVEFAGRRILFHGDISPQLFTQIMSIPKYGREIEAVDFWVLSHHGTNQAGELLEYARNSEMYMICSNPKRGNVLPWADVRGLPFKSRSGGTIVVEHDVSTRVKTDTGAKVVETRKKKLPVFVTCNAAQGYYELIITADGKATLFDGPADRNINDFCFQSL
ncbi:MAG: hypothetical protein LBR92_00495 [Puniceicoccales bacterium]|jgi:hypothetical protein|nr:hypothetical protein [Puniceicoccales bacterium]